MTEIGTLTTPQPDVLSDDALESTRWWIHQAAGWTYLIQSGLEIGHGREEMRIRLEHLTQCLQQADRIALREEEA